MSPYAILPFAELLQPLCVYVCVCYLYPFNMHAQIIKITERLFLSQLLRQRYSFETSCYYLTILTKTNFVLHSTGLGHGQPQELYISSFHMRSFHSLN